MIGATFCGRTWSISPTTPSTTLSPSTAYPYVLTYRDSDGVFLREIDPNDAESAQMMQMLGITEFVYHKQ